MSYDQKRKILEFVLKTERELGVLASSWKHCLLFLFHNGTLSRSQLLAEFTSPEELAKERLIKQRANTFDSSKARTNRQ